jgi:uncharacterized membrane protein (UPF0136 family)
MLKTYLLIFGAIVIAGGVQGYLEKGSTASIIAGSILGGMAVAAGLLLGTKTTIALVLGLIAGAAIAGRFLPIFLKAPDKTAALWPAGILSILGIIAVVLVIVEFLRGRA